MKKVLVILLSAALIMCMFSACVEEDGIVGDRRLKPTESVNEEDLIPENDFVGVYVSDGYTMTVEKRNGEEMLVTVTSPVKNNVSYEWKISGFFSEQTARINYTDAVKTAINYDKNGKETSRSDEYTYGTGRIQFSDTKNLTWNNTLDRIETMKFVRK